MAKDKIIYFCQECGHETAQWVGKCPACSSWNTLVEKKISKNNGLKSKDTKPISAESLTEIPISNASRISSGIREIDILMGGGIVPGAITLIGGEPGIGKSTLLLQIAGRMASLNQKVLYISAEESLSQLKMRSIRIGVDSKDLFIVSSGEMEKIIPVIKDLNPSLLIFDSIQAVYTSDLPSSPGSITQVRETTSIIVNHAKNHNIPVIITGHVTKDGSLAGPKTLEHMVDTVLYFEGSRDKEIRIVRSVKNRFGNVNEIGVFIMGEKGLKEVNDPASLFLKEISSSCPGSAVTAALEGNRVIIAEIQALVTEGNYGNISRTIDGVDPSSVLRLKAVIERFAGLQIADKEIFVNVTGGLKIFEPAVDLTVAMAIASSFKNIPLNKDSIFLGEISLLGELKRISQPVKRIQQAKRLGLKTVILPKANQNDCKKMTGIELVFIDSLDTAFNLVFTQ